MSDSKGGEEGERDAEKDKKMEKRQLEERAPAADSSAAVPQRARSGHFRTFVNPPDNMDELGGLVCVLMHAAVFCVCASSEFAFQPPRMHIYHPLSGSVESGVGWREGGAEAQCTAFLRSFLKKMCRSVSLAVDAGPTCCS
ncbi:Malonyl-[acyl-carrier protein] O-methyltransferase [Dissostichus eleginoides]|uniref:Malonyl-[acyl-carrier protein] O-methyltransferase n=1 Tax=Dissostichus eleginoides TaxID=100907 RepID=A0AAD9FBC8_DISEL|nr:Malonyl-[acyl-carrier protein] O-methyltransferase [Dissostichus eleginoides]